MNCNLGGIGLGLALGVGGLGVIVWYCRIGQVYGGWIAGMIERRENPIGFWSAIVIVALIGLMIMSFVWASVRMCFY